MILKFNTTLSMGTTIELPFEGAVDITVELLIARVKLIKSRRCLVFRS